MSEIVILAKLLAIHALSALHLWKTREQPPTDTYHYLYRCTGCKALLTKVEMIRKWRAAEANSEEALIICACGGNRISPSNAKWYEELLLPAMWELRLELELGRLPLAPPPLPKFTHTPAQTEA